MYIKRCHATFRHAVMLLWFIVCFLGSSTVVFADPVPPEQAFAVFARAVSPDRIEVTYQIRNKYYLYKNKLRFATSTPGITLGDAELPVGEPYSDPYFGATEIYRGQLRFFIPVSTDSVTTSFILEVTSQGCWDGGICYPPMTQKLTVALDGSVATAPRNALEALLQRPENADSAPQSASLAVESVGSGVADGASSSAVVPVSAQQGGASSDESGHLARMLRESSAPFVLLAFFGSGLLLAFTPCTFPMIPILSSIIVGRGQQITRSRAFVLSLVYVFSMAVTYAIAGVIAGLSGGLLSAALQNVWVLSAFALLFVLLSLSMFGFYELQLPSAMQSLLNTRLSRVPGGRYSGVIVMGLLSALIVGPCVAAPLAGALLYIAQTGDAVLGGVALFVMALGMGVPLIAVAVAAHSVLPKAGTWMENVRKVFGVILLGLALWLMTPVIPDLAVMLGWATLMIISSVYLSVLDPLPRRAKSWQRLWKGVGVILLVSGLAILVGALAGSRDPLQPLAVLRVGSADALTAPQFEKVRSVKELEIRLAAAQQPVLLDFYADWCVSCKEMQRFTFPDAVVTRRMEKMLLLKADVTANNDDDKALLKKFQLFGPPGIIFFDAQGRELASPRVVGFMKAEPFSAVLDEVLSAADN